MRSTPYSYVRPMVLIDPGSQTYGNASDGWHRRIDSCCTACGVPSFTDTIRAEMLLASSHVIGSCPFRDYASDSLGWASTRRRVLGVGVTPCLPGLRGPGMDVTHVIVSGLDRTHP